MKSAIYKPSNIAQQEREKNLYEKPNVCFSVRLLLLHEQRKK